MLIKKSTKQKAPHTIIALGIVLFTLVIAAWIQNDHNIASEKSEAADFAQSSEDQNSVPTIGMPRGASSDSGAQYYETALTFFEQDDFTNAISELRLVPLDSLKYGDAQQLLKQAEERYCSMLLENAKVAYEQSDSIAEIVRVLKNGLETLPDNAALLSAIDAYRACEPVSYSTLEHRSASGEGYYDTSASVENKEGSIRDASGAIHEGQYIDFWVHCMSSSCQMTQYTYGEYERFRGEYFLPKETPSNSRVIFKIYGDGKELFSSGEIDRKSAAGTFDIDISDVVEVAIYLKVISFGSDNSVDFYIFQPEVYNTLHL